jgi:hypothetical protein
MFTLPARSIARTHVRNLIYLARLCPIYKVQLAYWFPRRNEEA